MLLRCESLDPSMSQTGHVQTFGEPKRKSAYPLKSDIRVTRRHVCFGRQEATLTAAAVN